MSHLCLALLFILLPSITCQYARYRMDLLSPKNRLQSVAKEDGDAGLANSPEQRILGGTPAEEGAFPYMAKLFIAGGSGFCGGTLVSPNYVMTAAHCADAIYGYGFDSTVVALGTNRLDNQGGLEVHLESIVEHPAWQGAKYGNDIAVLKLKKPVDYPPLIQPVRLYGGDVNFTFTTSTLAGWGYYTCLCLFTSEKFPVPSDNSTVYPQTAPWLMHVDDVPIRDNAICNATWVSLDYTIMVYDNEICAGGYMQGSCLGDSGGPLLAQDPDSGVWYQDGIVSFAATYHMFDQGNYPPVLTRVSAECGFLKDVTGGEVLCGSTPSSTPRPPSNCPVGWRGSNAVTSKCYYDWEGVSGNFTEAITKCSSIAGNGTLVSIQNGFENSAVADEFRAQGIYWIGLNATGGSWAWIDGQNLTYTNWATGEPSQSSGCAVVDPKSMKWSVADCAEVHVAVCELFISTS